MLTNLKILKSIFAELIRKYSVEKKLRQLNITAGNDIQSVDVNQKSLVGSSITVLKGSYICGNSVIGSYNYIGFNTLISKTTIGRYNSIANNVNIGHGEHPLHYSSTSSFITHTSYAELTQKDCIIENDVWIASGATIRRGVKLGTGSIIGANAFVNKDVPPFAIVGGVPAAIIKYRFSKEKIQQLLSSKWWELEPVAAQSIISNLEELS